jgi:hypothetical protein
MCRAVNGNTMRPIVRALPIATTRHAISTHEVPKAQTRAATIADEAAARLSARAWPIGRKRAIRRPVAARHARATQLPPIARVARRARASVIGRAGPVGKPQREIVRKCPTAALLPATVRRPPIAASRIAAKRPVGEPQPGIARKHRRVSAQQARRRVMETAATRAADVTRHFRVSAQAMRPSAPATAGRQAFSPQTLTAEVAQRVVVAVPAAAGAKASAGQGQHGLVSGAQHALSSMHRALGVPARQYCASCRRSRTIAGLAGCGTGLSVPSADRND